MRRHDTAPLKRRPAARDPRRRFFIVCEGKNTEPSYFKALRSAVTDALIVLEIEPAAGVPMTIARRTLEIAKRQKAARKGGDRFASADEIWAVFDRDDHEDYDTAINLCQSHGVFVARSNPCFEIWLILHFRDYHRPDDRHAVQSMLQTLCPEYEASKGKTPDCDALMQRLEAAEERAERQYRARQEEGDPGGRPSTTVHHLTRAIQEAARRSAPARATID